MNQQDSHLKHFQEMPAFSRSGVTSPFGKLDDWLERTRIESQIKEQFAARARGAFAAAGYASKPTAEAVRDLVRVIALGPDMAKRMYGEGVLTVAKMLDGMSDKK